MPPPRSRAAIAAALALAFAGVGCSDDGADDAASATTAQVDADADADAEDEEATTTTADEATTTTAAGVAPATGPLLELPLLSLHLPEGWVADAATTSFLVTGSGRDVVAGNISLSQLQAVNPDLDLAGMAEIDNTTRFQGQGEIRPTVVVDGVAMAHVVGRSGARLDDSFVVIHEGEIVNVAFSLPPDLPDAERAAIIDGVLASVTWN